MLHRLEIIVFKWWTVLQLTHLVKVSICNRTSQEHMLAHTFQWDTVTRYFNIYVAYCFDIHWFNFRVYK